MSAPHNDARATRYHKTAEIQRDRPQHTHSLVYVMVKINQAFVDSFARNGRVEFPASRCMILPVT
jgi:hypothetical protein